MRRAATVLLLGALAGLCTGCYMQPNSRTMPTRRAPGAAPAVPRDVAEPVQRPRRDGAATWRRSTLRANLTRLTVGDRKALPLRALRMDVHVEGFRARVLLDLRYFNPHGANREGRFKLRLPDGASPFFLAFGDQRYRQRRVHPGDLTPLRLNDNGCLARTGRGGPSDGQGLKPAVAVPRAKAALAYAQTVTRRIDPALLEWEGGGVFSARVFPLANDTLHRIAVGYAMDLPATATGWKLTLPIPAAPTCRVSLSAPVTSAFETTMPAGSAPFVADGLLHAALANPRRDALVVTVTRKKPFVLTARDEALGPCWATTIQPPVPARVADTPIAPAVYLVDTSLSGAPDRFHTYQAFLRRHLEQNQDRIKRFAVLFFDVNQRWWRPDFAPNTAQTRAELADALNRIVLEGATDLAAALDAAQAPHGSAPALPPAGRLFLLSDGLTTWGDRSLASLEDGLRHRLYAYTTSSGSGREALRRLAASTGGALFHLAATGLDSVARAHRTRPWRLLGTHCAGGQDVVLQGRPTHLVPGQVLKVVGRGALEGGAELTLTLAAGQEERVVRIRLGQPVPGRLASRCFGETAVRALERHAGPARHIAEAMACHFRVVGEACSLVMLESDRDYERFGIDRQARRADIAALSLDAAFAELDRTGGGNTTRAMENWIESMAALELLPPPSADRLRQLLTQIPPEALRVRPEPLALMTNRGIPSKRYRHLLASGSVSWDAVEQELDRQRRLPPAARLKRVSSLIENNPSDPERLRDIGFRAMAWGYWGHAYHLFRQAQRHRPLEPTALRAMALCLTEAGRTDLAILTFETALCIAWDRRFGDVRSVLEHDYLRLLRRVERATAPSALAAQARARQRALAERLQVGRLPVLATLMWNTDRTDVDLVLSEPGYRAGVRHGRATTRVGAGLGPEMIILAHARPGRYRLRARYSAEDWARTETRTRVLLACHRDWGTAQETVVYATGLLRRGRERSLLGKLLTLHSGIDTTQLTALTVE